MHTVLTISGKPPITLISQHNLWHWNSANVRLRRHNRASPGFGEYIQYFAASYPLSESVQGERLLARIDTHDHPYGLFCKTPADPEFA